MRCISVAQKWNQAKKETKFHQHNQILGEIGKWGRQQTADSGFYVEYMLSALSAQCTTMNYHDAGDDRFEYQLFILNTF